MEKKKTPWERQEHTEQNRKGKIDGILDEIHRKEKQNSDGIPNPARNQQD
jgi:hypothetical protein